MSSDTKPSRERLELLAGQWVSIQLEIERLQGLYREKLGPYEDPDNSNYAFLMDDLDPLWTEQKLLFYHYPFEEMVWITWIKPWMDEGYTNWRAAVYPYWVKQVFDLFD